MTNLEQAAERAVDDIVTALIAEETPPPGRWRVVEAAANRLQRLARELQRTQPPAGES